MDVYQEFANVIQPAPETLKQMLERFLNKCISLMGEDAGSDWFYSNVDNLARMRFTFPASLRVGSDRYDLAQLLGFIDPNKKTRMVKVKSDPKTAIDDESLEEVA